MDGSRLDVPGREERRTRRSSTRSSSGRGFLRSPGNGIPSKLLAEEDHVRRGTTGEGESGSDPLRRWVAFRPPSDQDPGSNLPPWIETAEERGGPPPPRGGSVPTRGGERGRGCVLDFVFLVLFSLGMGREIQPPSREGLGKKNRPASFVRLERSTERALGNDPRASYESYERERRDARRCPRSVRERRDRSSEVRDPFLARFERDAQEGFVYFSWR